MPPADATTDKPAVKSGLAAFEEFHALPISEKIALLSRGRELYHCLFAEQFDRPLLDRLGRLCDHLRVLTKTKEGDDFVATVLSHRRAMLYFSQPSTRTFLSFQNACHILGMKTCEIRDPRTSSEMKGESFEDSIRTFASYTDIIIIRHFENNFAEHAARVLHGTPRVVPIVNAGAGTFQHPTQALLDVYTMNRCLEGGIEGTTLMLVGDLKRGRTVRSLALMMRHYRDVRILLVSPPEFRMRPDILDALRAAGVFYEETSDFAGALSEADTVYMTRVQDEHDAAGESRAVNVAGFVLRPEHLRRIKPKAIILHPLPRRGEIDPAVDLDPRAAYWRQERNGLWTRAALIAMIFGAEKALLARIT
ncbi:MAG: aspartate carbamoyltransferase [Elusimicrobia bacterium]|nr:aspartate carbamoyltransferase [Elusimicrobiota bacterium]